MPVVGITQDDWLRWHCPGCESGHGVPIKGERAWGWNGSVDAPTLIPSVLLHSHARHERSDQPRCHCFITNGQIRFLSDCDHRLAGQTVKMEEETAC